MSSESLHRIEEVPLSPWPHLFPNASPDNPKQAVHSFILSVCDLIDTQSDHSDILLYLYGFSKTTFSQNFPVYQVGGSEDTLGFVSVVKTQRLWSINVSSMRKKCSVPMRARSFINTAAAPTEADKDKWIMLIRAWQKYDLFNYLVLFYYPKNSY